MNNNIAYEILAKSLNTKNRLTRQLLIKHHDEVLNNYIIDMSQQLLSSNIRILCDESPALENYEDFPDKIFALLNMFDKLDKLDAAEYTKSVQYIMSRIIHELIIICNKLTNEEIDKFLSNKVDKLHEAK